MTSRSLLKSYKLAIESIQWLEKEISHKTEIDKNRNLL
jgi:hypothetical protein